MCLIVFKENKDSVFTNRNFKTMITRNSDGLGLMWRENGRVRTEKCMGTPSEKFKLCRKYRNLPTYAMHARIRTHGLTNEANCHPYEIMNMDKGDPIDLYMMHNGMISAAPDTNKDMSDTWHYVEYVLKPLIKSNVDLLWNNEWIQNMISKDIGFSKLLFMRSDGEAKDAVLVLNFKNGTERNGCWLSNDHSTEPHRHVGHNSYSHLHRHDYSEYNEELYKNYRRDNTPSLEDNTSKTVIITPKTTMFDPKNVSKMSLLQPNGKNYLPNATKEDNIIELKPLVTAIDDPNENLLLHLHMLRGMSDWGVKEALKDDPDLASDIILTLYTKNTMSYEDIVQAINDKDDIEGIVRLIRQMEVDEGNQIKNYR